MIHATAIIHPNAQIGKNVSIGPYSIIGEHVILDHDVVVHAHVNIDGHTHIGAHTQIFPFASIGSIPQDLKYKGEPGRLTIGSYNVIREHVTINIGTDFGGMLTAIGDHNLLMVGAHVGHDSIIGSHVILVNNATLAGHVVIEDRAILGGLSAVHQFCHIGSMAMIGGMTGVENDVIPYGMVTGNRANLKGLNLIGLERSGLEKNKIHQMRAAFKKIFQNNDLSIEDRLMEVEKEYANHEQIMRIIHFLRRDSKRRFVMMAG